MERTFPALRPLNPGAPGASGRQGAYGNAMERIAVAVFNPILVFLPVFVAIIFIIANQRRGPRAGAAVDSRKARLTVFAAAVGFVLVIGVGAAFFMMRK